MTNYESDVMTYHLSITRYVLQRRCDVFHSRIVILSVLLNGLTRTDDKDVITPTMAITDHTSKTFVQRRPVEEKVVVYEHHGRCVEIGTVPLVASNGV